jgi:asparagine synthase (glutamine-hydrolysing)
MFLCAFRPGGEPFQKTDLFGSIARLRAGGDAEVTTTMNGPFAALADTSRSFRPMLARWRHLIAVGDARLDNRSELRRYARIDIPQAATDLEVILAAYDAIGERCIPELLGDFGFVLYDARAQKLIAARDAFGIKPLYYRTERDRILFSSRMRSLGSSETYDMDHVAEFLLGLESPRDRTIWADVSAVPAGGYVLQRGTVRSMRRYWSPETFVPREPHAEGTTEKFRELLRDAVRSRIDEPSTTWAQLSGGIDSSSVVAMAEALGKGAHGLAGTLTLVDTLGNGDERAYSDSVVRRYDLRNEQVRDYWAWQDDGVAPPATDGPGALYPFYARDRRMCDIVRGSGGRVILSGFGSDHYLHGHLTYITDMASSGRVVDAVKELAGWSIGLRQSFWQLAREHVVTPFLPARMRGRTPPLFDVPSWIDPSFAGRHGLAGRLPQAIGECARPGAKFHSQVAHDIASIPNWVERWSFADDIEMRYPFLHRPLVEMSLQLPVRSRIRPCVRKWVLREAMRGLLPEEVRTRSTKATIEARVLWSLQRERRRIDEMLAEPLLGRLGCIRTDEMRRAVDAARRGRKTHVVYLMSALALETWLSVTAGRWTMTKHAAQTAA